MNLYRYVGTAATYLGTLWLMAIAAIFWILSIDGPESEEPSQVLKVASYVGCALAVIIVPAVAARVFWKRAHRRGA